MRKRTAKWIQHNHLFRKDEYECSSCGSWADKPYRTCPSCGISIKGSKYDPSWVDAMETFDAMLND